MAQEVLPEITVTSPIRRAPIRRAPAAAPSGPVEPAPAPEILYRGTLPIVTNEFATVTVVTRDEIDNSTGQTLGDVLQNKPGITSSGFAPGAASRPIVRGLDNYRVRIQENGIGASGVSELGEDHGVPIDPLAAQQIEVICGPATLRYGSQAIGGVVNADNNRIPTFIRRRAASAGEFRSAVTTVDKGRERRGAARCRRRQFRPPCRRVGPVGAAITRFHPIRYLYPEDPAPQVGRWQPNSVASFQRQSPSVVPTSSIQGFIGVAVSTFDSLYRVPGQEATETQTRIDMNQTKITSKGEYRPDGWAIDAIRFWAGADRLQA